MVVEYELWKENFTNFCESTSGEMKFTKVPAIGYGADYINCQLEIDSQCSKANILLSQNIITGNNEGSPSVLNLEYKIKSSSLIQINITTKNYFSNLFSKSKIKSGNFEFDKKFSISTTNKTLALSIIRDSKIRNFLLKHHTVLFNVYTENNECVFKMKCMEKKIYSIDELKTLVDVFRTIIIKYEITDCK